MPTLIGDGGHARDIWETLPKVERDRYDPGIFWPTGWKQIAHSDDFVGDTSFILGINDPQIRSQLAAGMEQFHGPDEPWIHPDAFIGPDCEWGHGTHVNYGVTMTRTTIGHHTTIAPGVTICGDVTIGDRVFIGAGAIIVNLTTVPDDTFIKAGTVWTQR